MKIIISMIVTFSVILIIPNAVAQVYYGNELKSLSPTLSLHLTGVESRNSSNWPWAVGGQYSESQETLPLDSISLNLDFYEAKVKNLNKTYEPVEHQLGDIQRTTIRFPFVQF